MGVKGKAESGEYLTFVLGTEVYAISIKEVREVLDTTKLTRIPRMPEFMKGVINLRGGVVPVFNLHKKFELEEVAETVNTCTIILEIEIDSVEIEIGIVADSVQQVITIDSTDIEPAPSLGSRLKTEFISGMYKLDETFVVILNITKVFSEEEFKSTQSIREEDPVLLESVAV